MTHTHLLVLPYKWIQGRNRLQHIKREMKEHHQDLIYSVKCPMKNCLESYNGETGRGLIERVNEHSRKDINSHMFKHLVVANHPTVIVDDFTVLCSGYRNRKFKRKVSESLFIKQNRPTLNKHGTSVPLKLFNW